MVLTSYGTGGFFETRDNLMKDDDDDEKGGKPL